MSEQSQQHSTASSAAISTSASSAGRRRGKAWVWVAAAVLVGGAVVALLAWVVLAEASPLSGGLSGVMAKLIGSGTGDDDDVGPTALVLRGPMVVSVTESGEITAAKRIVISNELKWPVIIKKVVAEGAQVSVGEDIVVFECRQLLEEIEEGKLNVTSAQNDHTAASEQLKLRRKEMDNVVRKAEQAVVDADEDLRRYEEGEWPIQKAEAESDIQLVRRDLALAKDKLDFKLKVNADKELKSPYSESEIEADKLGVERLKFAVQKAVSERDMLMKYNHPRELRQLKTGVKDAELALEKARVEKKTTLLVAEANALAKKQRYEMRKDRLDEFVADEKKLVVTAETTGLVVYDTGGRRYRPSDVTVEVGAQLQPRQQIMIIPDMTTLQVETKVYEAIVDKVEQGMTAYVRLDARPGQPPILGRLERVSPLPDSQRSFISTGVKVFSVVVKFDKQPEDLKPGLTAQVEMVLATLPDALSVPIAAVYTRRDRTFVRRVVHGKIESVNVKIGHMSDKRIEIVSGLKAGDKMLLVPPTGALEAARQERARTQPGAPPEVGPPEPMPPERTPPEGRSPERKLDAPPRRRPDERRRVGGARSRPA